MKLNIYIILVFLLTVVYSNFASNESSNDSILLLIDKLDNKSKINKLIESIDKKIENLDKDNIILLDTAYHISKRINDKNKTALINQYYGQYWKIFGNYDRSSQYLFNSIKYYEAIDDNKNLASAYIKLAETYRAATDYSKALEFLNKSERIAIKLLDSLAIATVYNRFAAVQLEIKKVNLKHKTIGYAQNSLKLIDIDKHPSLAVSNYILIGAAYRHLAKYDTAEVFFLKGMRLSEKFNDIYNYPSILTNLCDNYYRKGELQKAVDIGLKCYDFTSKKNIQTLNAYLYETLYKAYMGLGKYKEANYFIYQVLGLKDSLYYVENNYMMLNLQAKYESEKKEQQIEKAKQKQIYIITIFIVVLVFLTGIFFLYYSKQKQLKKKNEKISSQNEQLKELNVTKDKFFSIIAHDLKGPISTFKNITDLMVNDFDIMEKKDSKEFFVLMKKSSEHLAELLENLLTWSRSQRGAIEFDPQPWQLNLIIEDNIKLMSYQAIKKNITLKSTGENDFRIIVDINMINAVIRNLISNSIKFTNENGEIIINSYRENYFTFISVSDNGIGIDEKTLDSLFRLDCNITTLGTNNEKGTGLGLIICKEFVENHSGSISVKSELGKGSTFTIILPDQEHFGK